MEKVEPMEHDKRYEIEMFKIGEDNLQDPSIYDSDLFADFHSPILCENEEMMAKQIQNINDVPEDLQKCLGGARLMQTYSKMYNNGLRRKNLYQGNDYTIRSPIDVGFQRNVHPDSLYNLVKTRKVEVLELKRGSVFIKIKNITSSPVRVYYPKGSVVESPTSEQPCLITEDWKTVVEPGETKEIHLNWNCMAKQLSVPNGDFRLTPFVVFTDDKNYDTNGHFSNNYWDNVQPDISLNLQPTSSITTEEINDSLNANKHESEKNFDGKLITRDGELFISEYNNQLLMN